MKTSREFLKEKQFNLSKDFTSIETCNLMDIYSRYCLEQAGIKTNIGGPVSAVSGGGEQLGNEGSDVTYTCMAFHRSDECYKLGCKVERHRAAGASVGKAGGNPSVSDGK